MKKQGKEKGQNKRRVEETEKTIKRYGGKMGKRKEGNGREKEKPRKGNEGEIRKFGKRDEMMKIREEEKTGSEGRRKEIIEERMKRIEKLIEKRNKEERRRM